MIAWNHFLAAFNTIMVEILNLQDIDEDDENDFNINESDNLLVLGKADDEFSTIEVHG